MQRTMTILTVEVTKVDMANRTFEEMGTIKVPSDVKLMTYLKLKFGDGIYTTNVIASETDIYKMTTMKFYENATKVEKENKENE